jgi:hypothetical protein
MPFEMWIPPQEFVNNLNGRLIIKRTLTLKSKSRKQSSSLQLTGGTITFIPLLAYIRTLNVRRSLGVTTVNMILWQPFLSVMEYIFLLASFAASVVWPRTRQNVEIDFKNVAAELLLVKGSCGSLAFHQICGCLLHIGNRQLWYFIRQWSPLVIGTAFDEPSSVGRGTTHNMVADKNKIRSHELVQG